MVPSSDLSSLDRLSIPSIPGEKVMNKDTSSINWEDEFNNHKLALTSPVFRSTW